MATPTPRVSNDMTSNQSHGEQQLLSSLNKWFWDIFLNTLFCKFGAEPSGFIVRKASWLPMKVITTTLKMAKRDIDHRQLESWYNTEISFLNKKKLAFG